MRARRAKYLFELFVRIDRSLPGRIGGACVAIGGVIKTLSELLPKPTIGGIPPGQLLAIGDWMETLRAGAPSAALALIAVGIVMILLHIAGVSSQLFVQRRPESPFTTRLITDLEDAREVQTRLVRNFFPRSPLPSRALEAQRRNNQRLVCVFERDELVGYCALWPVLPEIGAKLLAGEMTDDDLLVEHLLPTAENGTAEYVVVVGIGVLPEVSVVDARAGAKLIRAVREVIRDCYLKKARRKLTLIAIAYTDFGRRACRVMGMEATGATVVFEWDEQHFGWIKRALAAIGLYEPKRYPVCARQISLADVAWASDVID